jgi:molecular chaperone HtpG
VDRTFQVDLRGVVDLLSHHLYASPRVYVRELLQNAVDAITARRAADPDPGGGAAATPAVVRIEPPDTTGDGTLRILDTGVGLTEEQVHQFLATIGRSSKRDDLGFARHDFLGQFGIGLLSCFLVADEIRVLTRAEGSPAVLWRGFADGRYSVAATGQERAEVGTTVTLVPRRDAEQWLRRPTVAELATLYGSLLPVTVEVGPPGSAVPVSGAGLPWRGNGEGRRERLAAYCQELFGFVPFDVVDLSVPEAGLTGVAFVLPTPANPAARAGHRVYLKRMLLAEGAEGILPEWAFFARCVIDTSELRPTASREALYEDSLLDATREALGDQLRGWLVRLAGRDPRQLGEFLDVHHLGVKALALHDDEMLRLVERWWPMETNTGRMTLADFRAQHGLVRYSAQVDEFRQIGAVAAAQGMPVVNAGYIYDAQLIERLPQVEPGTLIERVEPSDLSTAFDALEPGLELAKRPFLLRAQRAVDRLGCEVVLRSYDPAGMPAMYLANRSAAFAAELRATRERADDVWADVLDALARTDEQDRPQLVLNYRNPLVRRISELADEDLVRLSVEGLYGQALLLGHHPLRPADAALLNSSFLGLLNKAVAHED